MQAVRQRSNLDVALADDVQVPDDVDRTVPEDVVLPAPSGVKQEIIPTRRTHAAFSAASESRGLKGPFQPSGFGSLFYFCRECGAGCVERHGAPLEAVPKGSEHAQGQRRWDSVTSVLSPLRSRASGTARSPDSRRFGPVS